MSDPDQRTSRMRAAAWLAWLLVAAVVALSAYIRHRQGGLGCSPWPACYGPGSAAAPGTELALARLLHRAAASLVLVLLLLLLAGSRAARPAAARQRGLAMALVALALGLALLGIVTPGAEVPAVAMANLLGGFMMLALLGAWLKPTAQPRLGSVALWASALLFVQVAGGALVSSSFAAVACNSWQDCLGAAQAAGWSTSALDPWRSALPRSDGAVTQWLHRTGSLIAAAAVLTLAWQARRWGMGRYAAGLCGLLVLQLGLGAWIGSQGGPLTLVLLHNLTAAALLTLAVRTA